MKKKKATKNDRVYIFRVTLNLDSGTMYQGRINQRIVREGKAPWREIKILGDQNLYKFAEAITEAFRLMFDHCFGFYSNWEEGKRYHDSKEMYEFFTDIGEDPNPGAKPVKTTKISQVFKELGKKMLFLFDYGDGWYFIIELKAIRKTGTNKSYPILSKAFGKSPEQYPPLRREI